MNSESEQLTAERDSARCEAAVLREALETVWAHIEQRATRLEKLNCRGQTAIRWRELADFAKRAIEEKNTALTAELAEVRKNRDVWRRKADTLCEERNAARCEAAVLREKVDEYTVRLSEAIRTFPSPVGTRYEDGREIMYTEAEQQRIKRVQEQIADGIVEPFGPLLIEKVFGSDDGTAATVLHDELKRLREENARLSAQLSECNAHVKELEGARRDEMTSPWTAGQPQEHGEYWCVWNDWTLQRCEVSFVDCPIWRNVFVSLPDLVQAAEDAGA